MPDKADRLCPAVRSMPACFMDSSRQFAKIYALTINTPHIVHAQQLRASFQGQPPTCPKPFIVNDIIYYDYPFSTPTENAVNTRYTQTASDPVRLLLSCCADGPPADTAPGIYCVECTYLKLYIVHYNCPARSHRTALTAKPP